MIPTAAIGASLRPQVRVCLLLGCLSLLWAAGAAWALPQKQNLIPPFEFDRSQPMPWPEFEHPELILGHVDMNSSRGSIPDAEVGGSPYLFVFTYNPRACFGRNVTVYVGITTGVTLTEIDFVDQTGLLVSTLFQGSVTSSSFQMSFPVPANVPPSGYNLRAVGSRVSQSKKLTVQALSGTFAVQNCSETITILSPSVGRLLPVQSGLAIRFTARFDYTDMISAVLIDDTAGGVAVWTSPSPVPYYYYYITAGPFPLEVASTGHSYSLIVYLDGDSSSSGRVSGFTFSLTAVTGVTYAQGGAYPSAGPFNVYLQLSGAVYGTSNNTLLPSIYQTRNTSAQWSLAGPVPLAQQVAPNPFYSLSLSMPAGQPALPPAQYCISATGTVNNIPVGRIQCIASFYVAPVVKTLAVASPSGDSPPPLSPGQQVTISWTGGGWVASDTLSIAVMSIYGGTPYQVATAVSVSSQQFLWTVPSAVFAECWGCYYIKLVLSSIPALPYSVSALSPKLTFQLPQSISVVTPVNGSIVRPDRGIFMQYTSTGIPRPATAKVYVLNDHIGMAPFLVDSQIYMGMNAAIYVYIPSAAVNRSSNHYQFKVVLDSNPAIVGYSPYFTLIDRDVVVVNVQSPMQSVVLTGSTLTLNWNFFHGTILPSDTISILIVDYWAWRVGLLASNVNASTLQSVTLHVSPTAPEGLMRYAFAILLEATGDFGIGPTFGLQNPLNPKVSQLRLQYPNVPASISSAVGTTYVLWEVSGPVAAGDHLMLTVYVPSSGTKTLSTVSLGPAGTVAPPLVMNTTVNFAQAGVTSCSSCFLAIYWLAADGSYRYGVSTDYFDIVPAAQKTVQLVTVGGFAAKRTYSMIQWMAGDTSAISWKTYNAMGSDSVSLALCSQGVNPISKVYTTDCSTALADDLPATSSSKVLVQQIPYLLDPSLSYFLSVDLVDPVGNTLSTATSKYIQIVGVARRETPNLVLLSPAESTVWWMQGSYYLSWWASLPHAEDTVSVFLMGPTGPLQLCSHVPFAVGFCFVTISAENGFTTGSVFEAYVAADNSKVGLLAFAAGEILVLDRNGETVTLPPPSVDSPLASLGSNQLVATFDIPDSGMAISYVTATLFDGTSCQSGGSPLLVPQLSRSVMFSGLIPQHSYSVQVQYVALGFGSSPWSSCVAGSTGAPPPMPDLQNLAVLHPLDQAILAIDQLVNVQWNSATAAAALYHVQFLDVGLRALGQQDVVCNTSPCQTWVNASVLLSDPLSVRYLSVQQATADPSDPVVASTVRCKFASAAPVTFLLNIVPSPVSDVLVVSQAGQTLAIHAGSLAMPGDVGNLVSIMEVSAADSVAGNVLYSQNFDVSVDPCPVISSEFLAPLVVKWPVALDASGHCVLGEGTVGMIYTDTQTPVQQLFVSSTTTDCSVTFAAQRCGFAALQVESHPSPGGNPTFDSSSDNRGLAAAMVIGFLSLLGTVGGIGFLIYRRRKAEMAYVSTDDSRATLPAQNASSSLAAHGPRTTFGTL